MGREEEGRRGSGRASPVLTLFLGCLFPFLHQYPTSDAFEEDVKNYVAELKKEGKAKRAAAAELAIRVGRENEREKERAEKRVQARPQWKLIPAVRRH